MKVLIYGNRKQDDDLYDISTPKKEVAAFLALFHSLDEDWNVYSDLEDEPETPKVCEPCTKDLHRLCEQEGCICEVTSECKQRSVRVRIDASSNKRQRQLYERAKAGDGASAKKLLYERRNREYEGYRIAQVVNPLEKAS